MSNINPRKQGIDDDTIEIRCSVFGEKQNSLKPNQKNGDATEIRDSKNPEILQTTLEELVIGSTVQTTNLQYENGKLYRNGEFAKAMPHKSIEEYLAYRKAKTNKNKNKDEGMTH